MTQMIQKSLLLWPMFSCPICNLPPSRKLPNCIHTSIRDELPPSPTKPPHLNHAEIVRNGYRTNPHTKRESGPGEHVKAQRDFCRSGSWCWVERSGPHESAFLISARERDRQPARAVRTNRQNKRSLPAENVSYPPTRIDFHYDRKFPLLSGCHPSD